MGELPFAGGESVTDLPKRMGTADLAEEHGDELAPRAKSLGVTLGLGLFDPLFEFDSRKQLQNLAEHATDLHRLSPPRLGVNIFGVKMSPHHTSGDSTFKIYFGQE